MFVFQSLLKKNWEVHAKPAAELFMEKVSASMFTQYTPVNAIRIDESTSSFFFPFFIFSLFLGYSEEGCC